MIKQKFNVLEYDFNSRKIKHYDILPYFRNIWKCKKHNAGKDEVKDKKTLKKWIDDLAKYQFWARCEYEFLIGSWPFGSYQMKEDIKDFLSNNPNFDMAKIDDSIKFTNIIIQDMQKIDVYEQIKMNIDVITDILYKEFFKEK